MKDFFHTDPKITIWVLMVRLAVAFALGCVVAGIYRLSRRAVSQDSANLLPTLVMLTVLIAMVTLVIGESTARAFGLVGALSIVRFRTIVEDTRDTAFVILAVSVGMAIGAGFLDVPLIGLPIAAIAALLFRPRDPMAAAAASSLDFTLVVRVAIGRVPDVLLSEAFTRYVEQSRLLVTSTTRQGAALELTYSIRLRQGVQPPALVADLNGIEGIQGVDLRQS
jgi:hypothetical protein